MIYISTSCLKEKSVKKVLNEYAKAGIKYIELGSSHEYEEGINEFLYNYKRENYAEFIIHNYFPAPKNEFVMNFASQNPEILSKSMNLAKEAINLVQNLGSKLYSLNSGMRVDPAPNSLGQGLNFNKIIDYEKAFKIFTNSIKEICNYAEARGVKIAIENHELSTKNIIGGENKLLIMTKQEEFLELIKRIDKPNLGILIDLGHLNVTSKTLELDKEDFINKLMGGIFMFHLHDNDGLSDQHKPVKINSWVLQTLKQRRVDHTIPIVIESVHDSVEDILKTKKIIEEVLR